MPAGSSWHVPFVHSSEPRQSGVASEHVPPASTSAWQVSLMHDAKLTQSAVAHEAPTAAAGAHFIVAGSQYSRESAHGISDSRSHISPEPAGRMHVGDAANTSQIIGFAHATNESHAAPTLVISAVQVPVSPAPGLQ